MARDPVEQLRQLCVVLPEVTERLTHGEPGFFVRDKKLFVVLDQHHHGADHLGFWCAAPPGAQEALLSARPESYYRPPYVGHRGWVGMRIDGRPDWAEVAEIVTDAYRQVAPKKLIALLG
jgi:hypothetical protein